MKMGFNKPVDSATIIRNTATMSILNSGFPRLKSLVNDGGGFSSSFSLLSLFSLLSKMMVAGTPRAELVWMGASSSLCILIALVLEHNLRAGGLGSCRDGVNWAK